MNIACRLFFLLIAGMSGACSFSEGPVEGQVRDYTTGQPIADAIVIARWMDTVPALGHARTACIHVETAVTDAEGKYRINRWWRFPGELGFPAPPPFDVYKPGYASEGSPWTIRQAGGRWVLFHKDAPDVTQTFIDRESAAAKINPSDLFVQTFMGTSDARFEYLEGRVMRGTACNESGPSEKNLYPVLKAAYSEAKPLARTVEQRNALHFLQLNAAMAWLSSRNYLHEPDNPMQQLPDDIRKELE